MINVGFFMICFLMEFVFAYKFRPIPFILKWKIFPILTSITRKVFRWWPSHTPRAFIRPLHKVIQNLIFICFYLFSFVSNFDLHAPESLDSGFPFFHPPPHLCLFRKAKKNIHIVRSRLLEKPDLAFQQAKHRIKHFAVWMLNSSSFFFFWNFTFNDYFKIQIKYLPLNRIFYFSICFVEITVDFRF